MLDKDFSERKVCKDLIYNPEGGEGIVKIVNFGLKIDDNRTHNRLELPRHSEEPQKPIFIK